MTSPMQMTALVLSDLPWQQRYPEIAAIVKASLTNMHGQIGTTELVERIMPVAHCRGEAIAARNQFFRVLMTLAKHDLKLCVTVGEAKRGKYKMVRPLLWHDERKPTCPHCGGVL